jgi:DNA topoisomerase I
MPTQLKPGKGKKHLNILRTKRRKQFLYIHTKGGHIDDIDTLKRIDKLRIPPGYDDVKISSSRTHKLQATGVDTKGRVQYIYNDKFVEKRSKAKFKELINFGNKIDKIKRDVMTKLKDNDSMHSKSKIIALVIFILDNCLFRIGNKTYAQKYGTYGTTTLKQKHFNVKGGIVYIQFIGKKNVMNHCQINNKYAVNILKKLVKDAGKKNNVFRYLNDKGKFQEINANDINTYLKRYDSTLTVKMFRTWAANYIFLQETVKDLNKHADLRINITDMYAKKHVVKTLKTIAEKLHNTPTVSKKSYMNNEILNLYLKQPIQFYKGIKNVKTKDLNKLLVSLLINY